MQPLALGVERAGLRARTAAAAAMRSVSAASAASVSRWRSSVVDEVRGRCDATVARASTNARRLPFGARAELERGALGRRDHALERAAALSATASPRVRRRRRRLPRCSGLPRVTSCRLGLRGRIDHGGATRAARPVARPSHVRASNWPRDRRGDRVGEPAPRGSPSARAARRRRPRAPAALPGEPRSARRGQRHGLAWDAFQTSLCPTYRHARPVCVNSVTALAVGDRATIRRDVWTAKVWAAAEDRGRRSPHTPYA